MARAVGRPAGPLVRGEENRKTQQKNLLRLRILLRVVAMQKRTIMRNRTKNVFNHNPKMEQEITYMLQGGTQDVF